MNQQNIQSPPDNVHFEPGILPDKYKIGVKISYLGSDHEILDISRFGESYLIMLAMDNGTLASVMLADLEKTQTV